MCTTKQFIKLFLIYISICISLSAHQLRENYLQVSYNPSTNLLNANLEVETRLLENKHKFIDDNHNEIISFKELKRHKKFLLDYVCKHITFKYKQRKLSMKDSNITFHRYQSQTYMQVNKSFYNIDTDGLEIDYNMFFDIEKNHKLIIHLGGGMGDYILSNNKRNYTFSSTIMTQIQRLYTFIQEGIFHILDGTDHLLFVLMILLPTFALNYSYWQLIRVITAFSLAHSITLFISGFGLYTPNIPFVEASIALSIFIVAILNFLKKYSHVNYKIVFFFGLMHGFGFANVLSIAQIHNTTSFLVSLFGFNIGVEFGQIFVIILYLIPLYFIKKYKYKEQIIRLLSVLTALISLFWFMQRIILI